MTAIRIAPTVLVAGLLLAGAGCNNQTTVSTEEPNMAGKAATVELRPVMSSGTTAVHKQRTGKLIKVNSAWVVMEESGVEIWIPKEMILEIRLGGE